MNMKSTTTSCVKVSIKQEDSSNNNEDTLNKLSGFKAYAVAISAILGAGVLYMHAGIFTGGILAWVIGVGVCALSSFYISQAVYRKMRHIEEEKAKWEKEKEALRVQNYFALNKTLDTTDDSNEKMAVDYPGLIGTGSPVIQKLLSFSIGFQGAASLIIYMGLLFIWSADIIKFLTPADWIDTTKQNVIIYAVSGLIVLVCGKHAIKRPGKDSKVITTLSALCIAVLFGIVLSMLLLIIFNPNTASNTPETFTSESVKGLAAGVHFPSLSFISGTASMLFALCSHQNIPIYQSKMQAKRKRTLVSVAFGALVIMGLFFLGIGAIGYFVVYNPVNASNPSYSPKDILSELSQILSDPSGSKVNSSLQSIFKWLIAGIKLSMFPVLINAFMWQSITYRTVLLSALKRPIKKHTGQSDKSSGVIVTAGIIITAITFLVVLLPINLNDVIVIVGGAATSFIVLFVPAYLIITKKIKKSDKLAWYDWVAAAILLSAFVGLFSYVVIYGTIEKVVAATNV
ncbi:hypothetical protein NEHOM01_2307, partial [Nematocida homosporus]|uniref:uncharacterized protein n=1 Tax=Nematocida homosporus TaxID=1912981 RepID=UPI00221EE3E6